MDWRRKSEPVSLFYSIEWVPGIYAFNDLQ